MLGLFVFLFGLIIGSFLNCVIWRTYKEESFLGGKSYCPHCKHDLNYLDLFPLFSFLFLKGKCRYCSKKISIQYPLVELSTAILFLITYLYFGISLDLMFWLIIASLSVLIFVYDLKYYIIPDRFIFSAILISIIYLGLSFFQGNLSLEFVALSFLSAIGASLFLFLIWFFSKGLAMGFGDVKLAFLIGLILGWPLVVMGVFLGFLFGAMIGTIIVIVKGGRMNAEVPFAPFLLSGMFVTIFLGESILNWYLSLI